MYKRVTERVLGIIGLVIAGIFALAGGFSLFAAQSPEVKTELANQGVENIPEAVDMMRAFGIYALTVGGIATVIAFVGVVLLSKKKRGIVPGILLIASGLIIGLGLITGGGYIPGVLLLAAGIVAWLKKPQQDLLNE